MAVFSTHSNKGLKNQSLLVPKSVDSMAWEESQQVFQAIKFAKKGKRKKEKRQFLQIILPSTSELEV